MSSHSSDFVHNFTDFTSKINEIRTKYGMPHLGVEYANNYGSENDRIDRPLSFLFFFDELLTIEDNIESNFDYAINLYKSLIDIIKIMPGFPGGGRSFIEIPLNISILELPNIVDQIKTIIDKFRDNFKYDQHTKHYSKFVDDDGIIKNIDFLTCLPEKGGSAQISFSFKYVMKDIILVIAVDSYWQPAINMMIRFIKSCIKHISFKNSNSKRGVDTNNSEIFAEIYNEFKNIFLFADKQKRTDNISYYNTSKNCFDVVDFSYCEYMGFIHRNAVITKLCHLISKIKNSNGENLIESFKKLLTSSYIFPSISKNNANAVEKLWLNTNDKIVNIQLIDHIYIKNAVHSTIHFIQESDGVVSIWFSKRIFNKIDFYAGEAFIFYGDHDGGFYVNMPKTYEDFRLMIDPDKVKYIALKNKRNRYLNYVFFDENYKYRSRESSVMNNEKWYMSADIFHPNWMQFTSHDKRISTQKLYGMSFTDMINNIQDNEEDIDPFNDLSKEIIPFQLYYEDVGLQVKYKKINDSFLVFDAIYQYLRDNGIEIRDTNVFNMNILHNLLVIKMMKSLDNMSVKELVDMQIERYERMEMNSIIDKKTSNKDKYIIYSQNHNLTDIRKYFEKKKKGYMIDRTEYDKQYGDEIYDIPSSSSSSSFHSETDQIYTRLYHYCKFEKIKK